ncbi:hypothetical protein [Nocardia cerradoensis]|uniref:Uncharacterized protein n=1 Tax=Nocardia cerradoensis TaxID=85688 RepID=A0A231HEV7_9NOCA|nr:hypothetical protein [Nocardia cerradoensis]NKY45396.1 hypothetical protein [Nocardia cerradoensis]OXR47419.1 hypothetical protein B7C42_00542 [Nocardia cerradoensis]
MTIPSWTDIRLGAKRRVALWLMQVVGEGNLFTKSQLREAFPDTQQIDRRMRELRDAGWRIDTNREDPSLEMHEHRFVSRGKPVWEPGQSSRADIAVTATERYALMTRDGHKCRSCGIGPGEKYAGTSVTSQLDIARRAVRMPDGATRTQLVVECNRCRIGSRDLTASLADVMARIEHLPVYERKMLAAWVEQDARSFSEVEELWAHYRTLPAEARDEVRVALQ